MFYAVAEWCHKSLLCNSKWFTNIKAVKKMMWWNVWNLCHDIYVY